MLFSGKKFCAHALPRRVGEGEVKEGAVFKNKFYLHAGPEEGGGPCVGGGSKGASYKEDRRLCHSEEGSNGERKNLSAI